MNKKIFQSKFPSSRPSLLSSTAPWIILMVGSLLFVPTAPLYAMEEDNENKKLVNTSPPCERSRKSTSTKYQQIELAQGNNYPSTQKCSENEHRLKQIKVDAKNLDKINAEKIEQCKEVLKCSKGDCIFLQGFGEITFKNLIITEEVKGGGFSGAIVPPPLQRNGKSIVVKKFYNIKQGIQELLDSLAAWDLNPVPATLKMAKICDAAYCINGSEECCFSIIMECASGSDINKCLGTALEKNAVKACAEYLAIFHIKNSQNLKGPINRKKYISHAATFSNTLSQNLLNDDNLSNNEEEETQKLKLLSLEIDNQLKELNDEEVKSNNIIQLLFPEKQESFISLAEKTHQNFKNNAEEIFRLLDPSNIKKLANYYLTITHGDAHGKNFFYEHLLAENNQEILLNSFYRITMIDYASIVRTYEGIGDPAEDVGRFLGSLWEWAAQKNIDYEKIFILQQSCIESYLKIIEDRKIFKTEKNFKEFQRIFKENCNFFKLRFYRVIFNSNQDQKVKLNILESWLRENHDLVKSLQKNTPLISCVAEEPELLFWKKVDGRTQYHHLPAPIEEFIESAAKESNISYLEHLRKMLADTGNVTLSSTAAIAGMGGVGKTTLALAYAHEALANNAYNLIYWIQCGTEFSLLKGYRELLLKIGISKDMGAPIRNVKDPQRIIELVKQRVPRVGRSLLIYDNVSDSDFLKGITPQENTDILITSRSQEGWKCALPLSVFRLEDSVNYLLGITGLEKTDPNKKIAGELANKLYHFPLVLAHAAHYLKLVGGDKISTDHFKKYLEDFKKNESIKHFQENINNLTENQLKINYKHLISRTLSISKKYLDEHGIFKPAEELLSYCSYLDNDSIPKEIFLEYWPNQSKEDVEKVLEKLSALSLIKSGENKVTFTIHQLLQLVIRDEQGSISNQQHQDVLLNIIKMFNVLFSENINNEDNIKIIGNYLLHFSMLLKHSEDLKISSEDVERIRWAARMILFNKMIDLGMAHSTEEKLKNDPFTKKINTSFECIVKGQKNVPEWLMHLVDHSHSIFQTALALMHLQGDFAQKDDKKTLGWLFKAESQGNITAKFWLGHMYANGIGIEKDKKQARQYYTGAAEKGHTEAQFALGQMNNAGGHYADAIQWFSMAADQGHPMAQYYLALFYDGEDGIMKDPRKAFEWYTRSAKQGLDEAQFALGMIYHKGKNGQLKNSKVAEKCYKKAAVQGHKEAQFMLGFLYASEFGNFEEAINWLKLATERDNPISSFIISAINYLKNLHQGKINTEIFHYINKLKSLQAHVDFNLTLKDTEYYSQTIKQNYDMAIEWCCKILEQKYAESIGIAEDMEQSSNGKLQDLAKKGEVEAQFKLGGMYEIGQNIPQSYNKALKWYLRAAMQGHREAQYKAGALYANRFGDFQKALSLCKPAANNGHKEAQSLLGLLYLKGLGVQQNNEEAFIWLSIAAGQGQVDALFLLGDMYHEGQGVLRDDEEARKWYIMAAEQGYLRACYMLGILYCSVFKDFEEAFRWCRPAAKNGFKDAQFLMGMLCFEGLGVDQSYDVAFSWFTKAAVQGHKEAQFVLGYMYFEKLIGEKNQQEAILWLTKAAKQGHKGARDMLEHIAQQKDEKAANYRPKLNFKEQLHSSSLQQQNDRYKYFQKQLLSKPEQQDQKSVIGTIHEPLEDPINIERKKRYDEYIQEGDKCLAEAYNYQYIKENYAEAVNLAIAASMYFSDASQLHLRAERAVEEAAEDAKFAREYANQ